MLFPPEHQAVVKSKLERAAYCDQRPLGAGAGLATLYAMLYWILRSEDYSLLMGSLLLFGVLTILMIATRRVDWSNVARLRRAEQSAP